MKNKLIAAIATAALVATIASPASAHISVIPGVSAAGNTTDALTVGKTNVLNFRIGHGCAPEKDIVHPVTKKLVLSAFDGHADTHEFKITVPALALGDAGTTAPRPAYIPGFKTKISKNADGSQTVTWTAISRDFDVPNGPTGDVVTTSWFDVGLRVSFATSSKGKTVTFPSSQKCLVDLAAVPKTKTQKAVKASTTAIYQTWDGSTSDTLLDNNKHETAPSVTVNP